MTFQTHFLAAIAGLIIGAVLVFVLLETRRRKAAEDRRTAEELTREYRAGKDQLRSDQAEAASERRRLADHKISLDEYQHENHALKRDLLNLETTIRKLRVDDKARADTQVELDQRARELADRYLSDVETWVASSITANNYAASKQRLLKVIDWSREIGFDVPSERESALLDRLKVDFEQEVRKAIQREEQARIKAQIREEQAREREIRRSLDAIKREKETIQAALAKALAEAGAAHSAEVEDLKARLADAEARNERAISQAQLTRAGSIYVISNIGAFGDGVFKIGMTRRLEPMDRISELGDASVPFPFDVHMMIACDDAPSLEKSLHREFIRFRVNKVNPRKEFFRVTLDEIRRFVEARHGQVQFTADSEALEYRQSIELQPSDQEYIERTFEDAEKELGVETVDD